MTHHQTGDVSRSVNLTNWSRSVNLANGIRSVNLANGIRSVHLANGNRLVHVANVSSLQIYYEQLGSLRVQKLFALDVCLGSF